MGFPGFHGDLLNIIGIIPIHHSRLRTTTRKTQTKMTSTGNFGKTLLTKKLSETDFPKNASIYCVLQQYIRVEYEYLKGKSDMSVNSKCNDVLIVSIHTVLYFE